MSTAPRILGIDIETSPALVYTWGLRDQNIGLNQIEEPTRVLCFAAKWFGERKVHFHREADDQGTSNEVSRVGMLDAAHDLLDEADVVVHYNGRSFDEKHLNREFLQAGMAPPAPFQRIDLLSTVRQNFRFLSSKLEHVATEIGLDGKLSHEGFDLWRKVLYGDPVAWRKMEKYNRRDTVLLEELYTEVLPWIKGHPNVNQWTREDGCPQCGAPATSLQKRGFYRTNVSAFQRYQCQVCKSWSRDGKRASGINKRSV